VTPGFPREPDDILPLYRPDILPLHGPVDADTSEPLLMRPGDARIEHLRRVSLFNDCTEEELRRIADISRTVEVPAGTVVTEIGAPGDSFFFIIDGRVSVQTPVGVGDPLCPGDFFGEMSLLDGEPRSATVTAMTDLRLLVVDRAHFWRLLNESPDLVRRILTLLSRRVRRLEQATSAMVRRMNVT
jgi:CRP/FNR family transcriptional regulator/CRP/FNR family cyclic AMP-dependent transcriptional regulator